MRADEFRQYLFNLPENFDNFRCCLEELKKGNCVALVGAGLSKPLGIPDWEDLVYKVSIFSCLKYSREYIKESFEKRLDVAEKAKNYWNSKGHLDKYYNFIRDMCRPKNMPYGPVHKELLQVRFLSYLTTNFDGILDNAANDMNSGQILDDPQIFPNIDPTHLRNRKIFYLHGRIREQNEQQNIVFTKSEYNAAYEYRPMKDVLWNAYSNMTIVMLGYSLTDAYIQRLFEDFSKQLNQMRIQRQTWGQIEPSKKRKHFILKGIYLLKGQASMEEKKNRSKRMVEENLRFSELNVYPIWYLLPQHMYSESEDDHINLYHILKGLPKYGRKVDYEEKLL